MQLPVFESQVPCPQFTSAHKSLLLQSIPKSPGKLASVSVQVDPAKLLIWLALSPWHKERQLDLASLRLDSLQAKVQPHSRSTSQIAWHSAMEFIGSSATISISLSIMSVMITVIAGSVSSAWSQPNETKLKQKSKTKNNCWAGI